MADTEPSALTTMLQFVSLVKQEDGLTAHQADLYTLGASLVGLVESIRQRHAAQPPEPINHLALISGLLDVIEFVTQRLTDIRKDTDADPEAC